MYLIDIKTIVIKSLTEINEWKIFQPLSYFDRTNLAMVIFIKKVNNNK